MSSAEFSLNFEEIIDNKADSQVELISTEKLSEKFIDQDISHDQRAPHQQLRKSVIPVYSLPIHAVKAGVDVGKNHLRKPRPEIPSHLAVLHEFSVKEAHPVSLPINREVTYGHYYQTSSRGNWFIEFPKEEEKLQPIEVPYVLNGAKKELWSRQNRKRAIAQQHVDLKRELRSSPIDHENNILFFLANWDNIVQQFYQTPLPIETRLPTMYEVDLNDYRVIYEATRKRTNRKERRACGSIDFLGFGPDNQGVIIEFGAFGPKKSEQIEVQKVGLEAILKDTNHADSSPQLTGYIGEYFQKKDGLNIVRVRKPVDLNTFSNADEFEIFSQK